MIPVHFPPPVIPVLELRGGMIGRPDPAPACQCPVPINDDGTCIRCGRDTDR